MQIQTQAPPLKFMSLGDSLTAGMQGLNLRAELQEESFPKMMADQMEIDFEQPLLDQNGVPPRLFESGKVSVTDALIRYSQVAGALAGPLASIALGIVPHEYMLYPLYHAGGAGQNTSLKPEEVQNVGIPGFELRHLRDVHNVYDVMEEMADNANGVGILGALGPYTREILQSGESYENGRSQVQRAIDAQPDLITLWAGNNDALSVAFAGNVDDETLTPMEDRQWTYHSYNPITGKRKAKQTEKVMPGFRSTFSGPEGVLTQLLENTEAEIAVMNIPDITVVPHLFKVGEKIGRLPFRLVLPTGREITHEVEEFVIPAAVKGTEEGDRSNFPAGTRVGLGMLLGKFHRILSSGDETLSSLAGQPLFTEEEVLDPAELAVVSERIDEFNEVIERAAEDPRVHLVDINSVLNRAKVEGVPLRGEGETAVIGTGFAGVQDERGFDGLFSQDGVHPTSVGQAVVANQILDVLRRELPDEARFDAVREAPEIDEKSYLPASDERPALVLTGMAPDLMGAT